MADSSYAEHHRTGHWEGIVLPTGSFGVVFCELFTGGISLNHILYGAAGSSDGTQPQPTSASFTNPETYWFDSTSPARTAEICGLGSRSSRLGPACIDDRRPVGRHCSEPLMTLALCCHLRPDGPPNRLRRVAGAQWRESLH